MFLVDITKLPAYLTSQRKRYIIRMNMELSTPTGGAGNRWKRRAGVGVVDSTQTHPHGMGAAEIARMLKTPNPA